MLFKWGSSICANTPEKIDMREIKEWQFDLGRTLWTRNVQNVQVFFWILWSNHIIILRKSTKASIFFQHTENLLLKVFWWILVIFYWFGNSSIPIANTFVNKLFYFINILIFILTQWAPWFPRIHLSECSKSSNCT